MNTYSHQTAPTQFVEANAIRFAYRQFGKAGGVPIVFNQHYAGTMDYWDPAVTDGLALDREVILFNNAGVSSSSGEVPTTFEQMGANAIAFSRALGLSKADVLGFSIGGMVEITLQAPDLVRKLILVGTGPRGGPGMDSLTQVGRPARGLLRLSQDDQAANPRGERQYRRAHAHHQLLHHAADHPQCAARHLPRLESRVATPISRAVCTAHFAVLGRVTDEI
jgi:pimeloyl-ACP methyl ester carboxylesterase